MWAKFGPGDRWKGASNSLDERDRNDQERLRDSGCENCINRLARSVGTPIVLQCLICFPFAWWLHTRAVPRMRTAVPC